MDESRIPLFAFPEEDHLIRIHLKLGLEDMGFVVVEDAETLALVDAVERP